MTPLLTGDDIAEEALDDWRVVAGALHTRLRFATYRDGLALVAAIGEAAEATDHHPDLDLRYGHLDVRLFSHDRFGLTRRDVRSARAISAIATAQGATAHPRECQVVEVAVDTARPQLLSPFWRAVLAVDVHPHSDTDLVDRAGRTPSVWFQECAPREGKDRTHVDVHVPADVAAERVADAVAAGGRVVTDEFAPSWWVLADPDDNLVCVCTWHEPPAAADEPDDAPAAAG